MNSTHLRNGELVDSAYATDRSLLYGDGVFTTILLRDGQPILIDKHLSRLKQDTQRLNIDNVSIELIKQQLNQIIQNHFDGIIRVTVSRSYGQRGYLCKISAPVYWVSINPLPEHIKDYQDRGIHVRLCQQRLSKNPTLAGIKHCNRLEQVLARNEWHDNSYQEGLMLDFDDHLIEGTMSNLFYIRDGTLFTPELTYSGVNGIMRAEIIAVAKKLNIPLKIQSVTVENINNADALFVTNSVIGIWNVKKQEETDYFNYLDNSIINAIKDELKQAL